MLYDVRERLLSVCYIFDELVYPGGANARRGLLGNVDAVFFKAAERWQHQSYGFNGAAAGTWILQSLNLIDLRYMGGLKGEMRASIPETSQVPGSPLRGFPALTGSFRVWEQIEQDLPTDADYLGEVDVFVSGSEGGDETVELFERYLPAPDGSEQDP
jgi:hypothetical protein